jgi:hypothetical protein
MEPGVGLLDRHGFDQEQSLTVGRLRNFHGSAVLRLWTGNIGALPDRHLQGRASTKAARF